jgi:octaprenyl-diphosphate synthase
VVALINGIEMDGTLGDLIAGELAGVSSVFERHLKSEHDSINDLCDHLEKYRGKMLRPTLVMLAGLASGGSLSDEHRIVAAVVEMIHMATLVHDDVLDESEVRRRGRTINDLHGNEMAVMLGDYLISNAFHLCSRIGDPEINTFLGEITNTLCEGEMVQLHNRNNLGICIDTYDTIVRKKTASLIGASCRLGAMLSGADVGVADGVERFGIASGIAFQITDDVLDLVGDEDVVGKSVGRDLEKGKFTLPIIIALNCEDGDRRSMLLDLIANRDFSGLGREIQGDGSIDKALSRAADLVTAAKSELNMISDAPAKDMLCHLADGILDRRF